MYLLSFTDVNFFNNSLHRIRELDFPDFICNWLCSFLTGRTHCTKWGGSASCSQQFNAGVVQGSAVGPAAYILYASELQPKYASNKLFKYADDSYLLVPASSVHTVPDEMENISKWSEKYNVKLNISKCKEMIVPSPYPSVRSTLPPSGMVVGIDRVKSLVILGVNITDRLTMHEHLDDLTTAANQTMFALRTLKRSGLCDEALWAVCRATLVAKIVYGSSAWWGFANKSQTDVIEGLLRRANKWGLYPSSGPTILSLVQKSDHLLFKKVLANSYHVMHTLLPPIKTTSYNLRPRIHDRVLPLKTTSLAKKILHRMLYAQ